MQHLGLGLVGVTEQPASEMRLQLARVAGEVDERLLQQALGVPARLGRGAEAGHGAGDRAAILTQRRP